MFANSTCFGLICLRDLFKCGQDQSTHWETYKGKVETNHFCNPSSFKKKKKLQVEYSTRFYWLHRQFISVDRDTGNKGIHKLIDLKGKINMVASSARALFHRFMDHYNNVCPEFTMSYRLGTGMCEMSYSIKVFSEYLALALTVNAHILEGRTKAFPW